MIFAVRIINNACAHARNTIERGRPRVVRLWSIAKLGLSDIENHYIYVVCVSTSADSWNRQCARARSRACCPTYKFFEAALKLSSSVPSIWYQAHNQYVIANCLLSASYREASYKCSSAAQASRELNGVWLFQCTDVLSITCPRSDSW